VSVALLDAARQLGAPATMVQLAHRACVGYSTARFKVPYLARIGALVVVSNSRPRLYALPATESADAAPAGIDLARAWWPPARPASAPDDPHPD
jgi:hypothetical protein